MGMAQIKGRAGREFERILVYPQDRNVTLMDNERVYLTATCYQEYPLTAFEDETFHYVLEGKIYGREAGLVKKQLCEVAKWCFAGDDDSRKALSGWLTGVDGEFVIVVRRKSDNHIVVLNDIFARLPLFICQSDGKVFLSRSFPFAAAMLPDKQFDRLSIAHYLLFAFCFGTRTFIENVRRIEPACLLYIDPSSGSAEKTLLYQLNFDVRTNTDKTIEQNGAKIAELFVKALKDRTEPGFKTVLSLSGGRDSRAEAAGFCAGNIPFSAVTFLDAKKVSRYDIPNAAKVAKALNLDWRLLNLPPATGKELLASLKLKGGLNYFSSAFIVYYFRKLIELFGRRIICFVGNGGDRVNGYHRPPEKIGNLDEMVSLCLKLTRGLGKESLLSLEQIAALTGVSSEEIIDSLKEYFKAYPEKNLAEKFVRFCLWEQSYLRYHDANDRDRSVVWCTTPYWSTELFLYMINCPDEQKKGHKLYVSYLKRLNEQVCKIQTTMNRCPVFQNLVSRKKPWYRKIVGKTWVAVRATLRFCCSLLPEREAGQKTFTHSPNVIHCLQRQIQSCPQISEIFNPKVLSEFVSDLDHYGSQNLGVFLTVTSMIEYLSEGKSTIESFLDENMDTY